MDKKILKQLKSDYEELEIKPSADLWSKIEAGIDEGINVDQKPALQWWKYAAVVLLLISFGTYFYFESQTDHKKILTKESPKDKVEKVNIINKESDSKSEDLIVKAIENVDSKVNLISKEEKPKQLILVNQENISEKNLPEEKIKQDETVENPIVKEIDHLPIQKQTVAERKKVNYTNAEQLLLGRELDKTREENQNEQRKFGVLDIGKIKIKSPNSFKILGFTIYSDSLETK
ncbi:hypothetical protein [Chryseobacterium sp. 3008163]|uniref:hypothetical protein n=1 Tax=Chryseobacterium sp. 3008163 TaxID=2478663 RepID=UPI000F0D11E6|nr:hypothetical protein [Chryseobacterium sp. 3008163]AYN02236.1 hypothetical protein EAG08_19755 [Chryseobacterium sp. 3008163]